MRTQQCKHIRATHAHNIYMFEIVSFCKRQFSGEREAWPIVAQVWSADNSSYLGVLKYHTLWL